MLKAVRFCKMTLWVLILFAAPPAWGETLSIPGTGACEPILADLAAAFNKAHPGDQVVVPRSSGSGGGIQAVLKGEAPGGTGGAAPQGGRGTAGASPDGLCPRCRGLRRRQAGEGIELSTAQAAAIFSGKIDNWKDVGGAGGKIRVIVREPGDSSLTVIQANLKAFKGLVFATGAKVILYDQAAVEAIDKYRNAVGFITLSSLRWSRGGIVPIALDGVAPSRENILAGKYTLVEDYAFVYRNGSDNLAKRFMDFVLSPQGGKVMEDNGLVAGERK